MSIKQARLKAILLCSALLAWAGAVSAQDYPDRPIRVIVPYPPGGGTDAVMRSVAPRLGELLGKPVVIENKPGGSSSIGLDAVAKARADGYTLGFVNMAFVANPSLMKLPFDTEKDFSPIGMVSTLPLVVAVNPSLPARSIKDFIALAKSQPGKLFYASAGNGTSNHLLVERFKLITGIDITHVPYKGGAPSVLGVISGDAAMTFASISSVSQQFGSGRLVPLATGGAKRTASLPEVPTLGETVPGFEAIDFNGLVAPAGTPPAVIQKVNQALGKLLSEADVRERLIASGAEPAPTSPQEFSAFMKKEVATWAKVIRQTGVTID